MTMMTAELPEGFRYCPDWITLVFGHSAHRWFDELVNGLAWEQRTVRCYGREHPTPRLICAMGASYAYSGQRHAVAPWHPIAADMRAALAERCGARFDSCLANLYRHGADSIAPHADDEPELGPEPTIASVSLGAPRQFVIQPRDRADRRRWGIRLGHGDLLVMSGRSQTDYLHSVPKVAAAAGTHPRVNLTFRSIDAIAR